MFVVILSAHYYVFYRLWHMFPSGIIGRLLIVLAICAFLSFFLPFLIGHIIPSSVTTVLHRVGTSWFFIFLYLLIAFLLLDLIRITHLLPVEKFLYNNWFGVGILLTLITGILTIGYFNYTRKERVELAISLAKEKKMEKPLKIVAISDLHLGYGIGKDELEQWVQLINKESPDVVLIAGDLIDNSTRPLIEQNMAESFSKIRTTYGIYFSVGNHEYISGISKSLDFLNKTDICVLRDSTVLVDDRFYIVGRDDRTNSDRKSIKDLTEFLDKSKPIILLDHQPYNLKEAEINKIDLQISGHTHRGQLIPISWITDLIFEKAHGYLKKENSHFYISSGLGIWGGKFRVGSQSEYVVINLK